MESSLTEQFLTYLATVRNLSPNTVATYRRTYRTFPGIETAGRDEVEQWYADRADLGLSTATRLNEVAAVRSFYAWCRKFDHRPPADDPTYRLELPRLPKGQPHPISRAELHAVLASLDDQPDLRRAVALGAYGGLRVSEAASLDWSDIDMETNRIRVTGKGGKTRLVGLSPLLLDSLLPIRPGNVVSAGGAPYTAAQLQRKVNRAFKAVIGDAARFHSCRHRFGTVALGATGNLLAVSRAMGHESPATTAIYAATADADLDVIAEAVTR